MTTIDLSEYDSDIYTLRDGHIAVSPFPEYPGEIHFPKVFTGKLFKQYVSSIDQEAQQEEIEGLFNTFLLFGRVEVEGMSTEYDANDMRLNRWCVAMLMRWVNPFLYQAPWRKPSGNGADTTSLPPG